MADLSQLAPLLGNVISQYAQHNVGQDVSNYSHEQTFNDYQQFAQNASPDQVYEAHNQYYQQMPEQKRQDLMSGILGALQQKGVTPEQTGIPNTNPTPQNLATINQYVSQKPDLMDSIFGKGGALSSPLAKVAMVGALAYAASKINKPH